MTGFAFGSQRPARGTVLRALRQDVRFPWVALTDDAAYAVMREDGAPDTAGGVLLVTPYEVPGGQDERMLSAWDAGRAVHREQRGYLGARLYQGEDAFRFVSVARWSSPLMYARALQRPPFAEAA